MYYSHNKWRPQNCIALLLALAFHPGAAAAQQPDSSTAFTA
jgi:hypothetical protein